jgi:[ribosomal protein S18]-alanine N-acetyltransferase
LYYFIEPMHEEDIEPVQAVDAVCFNIPCSAATYRRELRNAAMYRYVVARASQSYPPPRENGTDGGRRKSRGLQSLLSRFFQPAPADGSGLVVGYGGLSVVLDEGHVMSVAVAPRYRRQGVGELLLNGLIDLAFDMYVSVLTLEVRCSNVAAQALYQKYGFLVVGERPRYYTDNSEDALIMTTPSIHTEEYQTHLKQLRWQLFTRLRAQAEATTVQEPSDMPLLPVSEGGGRCEAGGVRCETRGGRREM